MKLTIIYIFINALLISSAFAEVTQRADLADKVWTYFESYEDQVREFHSRGGHLPDRVDVFFNFIRYETEDLAGGELSLEDELKTLRFLRRHISSVAIMCAPGESGNAEAINHYREKWLMVVLELDKYEEKLIAHAKLQ